MIFNPNGYALVFEADSSEERDGSLNSIYLQLLSPRLAPIGDKILVSSEFARVANPRVLYNVLHNTLSVIFEGSNTLMGESFIRLATFNATDLNRLGETIDVVNNANTLQSGFAPVIGQNSLLNDVLISWVTGDSPQIKRSEPFQKYSHGEVSIKRESLSIPQQKKLAFINPEEYTKFIFPGLPTTNAKEEPKRQASNQESLIVNALYCFIDPAQTSSDENSVNELSSDDSASTGTVIGLSIVFVLVVCCVVCIICVIVAGLVHDFRKERTKKKFGEKLGDEDDVSASASEVMASASGEVELRDLN